MKIILSIIYLTIFIIVVKITYPLIQDITNVSFNTLIFLFLQTSIIIGLIAIGGTILFKTKN